MLLGENVCGMGLLDLGLCVFSFPFSLFLAVALKLHRSINDRQFPSRSWVTFLWALKWQRWVVTFKIDQIASHF